MADRSFSGQLSRESEAWVAEGIVSAEQAAAIRSRYADVREERRGSATTALAVIGAIAVGFGVIGFIAANWEGMSHAARLDTAHRRRRRLVCKRLPPARPDGQQAPGRRGAVPGRRPPLRRVALSRRADVPRPGARSAGAPALGRWRRRDRARRPLARDRRDVRAHLHGLGRVRVRPRARRRRHRLRRVPGRRGLLRRRALRLRDRGTGANPRALVREQRLSRVRTRHRPADRGGRPVRLHLLGGHRGTRAGGRRAQRCHARLVRSPGGTRVRGGGRAGALPPSERPLRGRHARRRARGDARRITRRRETGTSTRWSSTSSSPPSRSASSMPAT